ncbi:MAG: TIGR04141 family sporadically distributed protein [Gemmatimonadales bacterium]
MVNLRIYRVVESFAAPAETLKDIDTVEGRGVRLGRSLIGMLYVKPTEVAEPAWIAYFDGKVDVSGIKLSSASSAAVLLTRRKARTFALTFGYGRFLLNEEAIEPRFGLRATLNAIEPSMIRSIDHRRLDAVSRHTREQVSRLSAINSFGVDVARDLLRAVTGCPTDPSLGVQLSGADVLAVVGKVPLKSLLEQLDRYAGLADQTTYRGTFPWVDNIAEVRAAGERERLGRGLVDAIKRGVHDRIGIAVPEIMDWSNAAGFRYGPHPDDRVFADLSIANVLQEYGRPDRLTLQDLHQTRIHLGEADTGSTSRSWPVVKCLVAELELDEGLFVLSEGSWYQVSRDYRDQVASDVGKIPKSTIVLPKYNGQNEGEYNQRAARKGKDRLTLLDRKLIACGNRSTVEPCDLNSSERQMVHVKRRGASSAMSHLFAQGLVAGEMFALDTPFRHAFNERLPAGMRMADPQQAPRPGTHELSYVLLGCDDVQATLPFLARSRYATRHGRRPGLASRSR